MMDFSDRKLEIAITGFAVVMMLGLGYLLKSPVQSVFGGSDSDIVYEMPRPKSSFFATLFGLGDREIERKYINPFAKKKSQKNPTAEGAVKIGTSVPPKPVAQKKQNKKKTESEQHNNKVDVQIVGEDTAQKLAEDDFWSDKAPVQRTADKGGSAPADPKDKRNGLDGNQWRALLMAQPTRENVNKLIEAYSKKEIDDQAFYTIVVDLFRNNKAEVQAYGLAAVKSAYNDKSFALTAQYFDHLAPELQPQANAYLLSYGVSGRLPILLSALQSSDAEVVSAAAQVVMDGHKKAKDGKNLNTDPRTSRGDVMLNTVSAYTKFVPVLQQLAQSPDSTIASLATSVLNEIQTPVAAL